MITNLRKDNTACIILAGGNAKRFGRNKLFLTFNHKPILYSVVDSIVSFNLVGKIIVVSSKNDISRIKKEYSKNSNISVVEGGENRIASTLSGLHAIDEKLFPYVYIHDAARPIFSKKDFLKLKKEIRSVSLDGVVLYVKSYDSLVMFTGKINNNHSIDKSRILQLKTPHLYKVHSIRESILAHKSYQREYDNFEILLAQGRRIGYVEGSIENIKITYASDIKTIKKLL